MTLSDAEDIPPMISNDTSHDKTGEKDLMETDGNISDASVQSSPINLYEDGVLDPVYHAKTLVLNHAIEELGMGKYQVSGFISVLDGVLNDTFCIVEQVCSFFCGRLRMVRVSTRELHRISSTVLTS